MSNATTPTTPNPLDRASQLLRTMQRGPAAADRRIHELAQERHRLVTALAGVDHALEFEAAKLEAWNARTLGDPDIAKRMEARPHDESIRTVAGRVRGGWDKLRKAGATDQQLLDHVASGWGFQTQAGEGLTLVTAHGKGYGNAEPRVTFYAGGELRGAELAAELRRLMDVPTPTEAAAAVAAKGKPTPAAGDTVKPTKRTSKRRPRRPSTRKPGAVKTSLTAFAAAKTPAAATPAKAAAAAE